jgi:hypothetical protein
VLDTERADMRQIYVAKDPLDAHLLKSLLGAQGIRAQVRDEALWGARGEAPLSPGTCPTVWIEDDRDHAAAAKIVQGYPGTGAGAAAGSSWSCSGCGEQLEPQFSECWSCGEARDLPSPPGGDFEEDAEENDLATPG